MIKIVDKIMTFVRENATVMDRALNRMAIDIERLSKAQVPLKDGQLRASGHFQRLGPLNYIVSYNMEYARFQEFGGDHKRTVRKYTTPGTKKFYLRDPGNQISAKAVDYFRNEAKTIHI
jgi:hypothetical protein